ncbi:hypothetical protein C2U69_11240 [Cupriavidus pinatubonensis]|nr:hypothetical protein C2U69_11240 [Cupriavidus pinatubonensis]
MCQGKPVVPPEEEVLRAVFEPYWDSTLGRATASIFVDDDISVSRLRVLQKNEIVTIFKQQFDSPTRTVHGVLRIAIETVQSICQSHTDSPRDVHACEDPTATDISHAVLRPYTTDDPPIRKAMSKGLARKVLNACEADYFP